ncbi:MAG: XRE family transcriptional regulator [Desulfovibrio sp.]|nr:XRE family transcriptional regulator [Desulfovibrio sp.]
MNTLKNFGERLKAARKGKLTQGELSLATGISQNAICNYENGKRSPNAPRLQSICDALGISSAWLLTGEGPKDLQGKEERSRIIPLAQVSESYGFVKDNDGSGMINVPLVSARLSAGQGSFEVQGEIEGYSAFSSAFLHRKGNPASMVVMKVQGDSMQPEIMDGDAVLIDQSKKEVRLGRIYAVGFEDAIYLKRIDKEPGKIVLKSVNPEYRPIVIEVGEQTFDSFRVIGQILWVGREYQE